MSANIALINPSPLGTDRISASLAATYTGRAKKTCGAPLETNEKETDVLCRCFLGQNWHLVASQVLASESSLSPRGKLHPSLHVLPSWTQDLQAPFPRENSLGGDQ